MSAKVIAVSCSAEYAFSKPRQDNIHLVEGLGVEGDAHSGTTVKHRSRINRDPTVPNLRQVHLIHAELFDELKEKGFELQAGDIGENILTRGIDLLDFPRGARLQIGGAVIEITGLRNPCYQLNDFQDGLMNACIDKDVDGNAVFKSGIMSVVLTSGDVKAGDAISIELPDEPHQPLEIV